MTRASNSQFDRGDGELPKHIAIIMDGNGRWAQQRGKARHAGHRAGAKAVRSSVETAARRGIQCLTLFAFSSENWSRPEEEIGRLMTLFVESLRREVGELHRNNVRIKFVGALCELNDNLRAKITKAEEKTAGNTGLQLTVAVAYGGRWDIVEASREVVRRIEAGELSAADVDEATFAQGLALAGLPDPDLLIRTGGEQRISNFLLWNLAYAELYFCDALWPDFDDVQFDLALQHFAGRQRRYGHTAEQVEALGC